MDFWQLLLLAVAIFALGVSLSVGSRRRQSRQQAARDDALANRGRRESSVPGVLQVLTLCTDADRRDLEAQLNSGLAALDQLILDADREIDRLQTLLANSRNATMGERRLTSDEQQRCFALLEADLSLEEIARCLMVSPESVQETLDEWRRPARRAA